MTTIPGAGGERQQFLDEFRAIIREELERLDRAGAGAGGAPGQADDGSLRTFLGRVQGLLDRELPIGRTDLLPLRGEFERVLSRLHPPRPVENDRLRGELEEAGELLGQGDDRKEVRDRWKKEIERLLPETQRIKKAIVAVHGIGDQYNFGTIQQTAHAFCRYMGVPASFPLGRFHGRLSTVFHALVPKSPPDPEWAPGERGTEANPVPWPLAFAEIYWASIPREVVKEGYTLEEAKTWARTLVERLRYKKESRTAPGGAADRVSLRAYEHFSGVVEDIVTSVDVAERLFRIVRYAGLGDFQLKRILDDYINDVQVVAEFYSLRRQLLDIFTDVMRQVSRSCQGAGIYIVAHSEGTVVAFLGLLEGLANGEPWVRDVKGLMTIGSPLNKHVLLWPEIFDEYQAPPDPPGPKIVWHNYSESGDPIGYNLKITYDWMANKSGQRWERFFDYDPRTHDHQYAHSPLPGDAHNHYWRDDKVFGHFISNVVDPDGELLPPRKGRSGPLPPPGGEWDKWIWSYFLPYLFSAGILLVGTYLLYKSARAVMDPLNAPDESPGSLFRNVFVLAALVAGTTGLATLPRLLKPFPGVFVSWVPFAVSAALFCWLFDQEHLRAIASGWRPLLGLRDEDGPPLVSGAVIAVTLAFAAGTAAGLIRWFSPDRGLRPMVVLGALAVALAIGPRIYTQGEERRAAARPTATAAPGPGTSQAGNPENPPYWPLALSALAFLYLWWLATLLFDMTVIWHVYVRWEQSQKYLEQIAQGSDGEGAVNRPAAVERAVS